MYVLSPLTKKEIPKISKKRTRKKTCKKEVLKIFAKNKFRRSYEERKTKYPGKKKKS